MPGRRHGPPRRASLEGASPSGGDSHPAPMQICSDLGSVGDFDPDETRELVETYFGPIPRGPQPTPILESEARLDEEIIVREVEPNGTDHKVWIAWITPELYAEGDAELDIASDLLSNGKDSRLYQRLVQELQIARSVDAFQFSSRLHGQYIIEATAASGHTTDELVTEIDAILDELRSNGPTEEEVTRAKLTWEVNFYQNLQTISARANQLSSYNTVTGNPGFITEDLARYQQVTTESLHSTVETWLPADRRVVLHVTPPAPEPVSEEN